MSMLTHHLTELSVSLLALALDFPGPGVLLMLGFLQQLLPLLQPSNLIVSFNFLLPSPLPPLLLYILFCQ